MPVFMILALSLAVLSVAAVAVAALQVKTAAEGLVTKVKDGLSAAGPLVDELGQEVAVTGRELESFGANARAH